MVEPYDANGLADAMAEVIANGELGEELKTKGLEQATKLSWQKTAEETIKVYREVEQRLEKGVLSYQPQAFVY